MSNEAKYRALLVECAKGMADAHESMFAQCLSNPITNAWGKPVNTSAINAMQGIVRRVMDALAEPPVQAEPTAWLVTDWLVTEHASEFNDYRTKYRAVLDKPKHGGRSLYLHPPVAQVATCSNCERCQESLNALDDLTEAQGKVNAELVEALEEIQGLTRWLREGGPDHLDLVDLSEALEFATDTAHAALTKYKEGL